ncbi:MULTISPECIES: glycosyltransferase [unclassified Okeania]|uniref:glycosyltransferase n=1 Tax=unclassified Okeania TaxID=2634635 RepID=UPI0013B66A00|nr:MULTISPECIES: glycosyltransferase [unclassified Okeania]NES79111.1 glycosyltransferase family 1 protein [Okeania sp. SIO1H4]NET20046.1 glycosyltransferase family 1 protein [Okeania sp. SIO1H5]NET96081.1 glycosyltransferase family 1 protein [Okeania sp. SIO1H2]
MRITILALGTRGDVQPYIALGLGLQAAGHQVKIASLDIFEDFISNKGLHFASLGGISKKLKKRSQNKDKINSISFHGLWGRINWWFIFGSSLENLMFKTWEVCQETDVIIYSRLSLPAYHIAEKLGIPCYAAYTNPLTPTRTFPNPLFTSNFNLEGKLNWLTHIAEEQFCWQLIRKEINQWRTETLNLSPIPITGVYSRQRQQKIPTLHCYSPNVLPKPSDWQDWAYVTGYWFLDSPANWQPPKELIDFLVAGSPPVYIGFGSMSDTNPEALTKLVLDALAQSGQRGILMKGWGALSNADLPDNVFKIDSVPHDWLFPQVAAVVHHGGAGTTSAGLRAGVPSIIIPFVADQPFWGQRLANLGVGTQPIPRQELTAERLASAITIATSDETMKDRARILGQKIRAENGVKNAVEIINSHLSSHH